MDEDLEAVDLLDEMDDRLEVEVDFGEDELGVDIHVRLDRELVKVVLGDFVKELLDLLLTELEGLLLEELADFVDQVRVFDVSVLDTLLVLVELLVLVLKTVLQDIMLE